jgi:hypothetical protein
VEFVDSTGKTAAPDAETGIFRFSYTNDRASNWVPPSYRIRLRNTDERPVYCAVLNLTDSWGSSDGLLPPTLVAPGADVMIFDGRSVDFMLPAGRPIVPGSMVRDKLVILASSEWFQTGGLTMGPLDSPATRDLATAVPVDLGNGDAEWGGRTIEVVTSVPDV